jgi:hypothetical protein
MESKTSRHADYLLDRELRAVALTARPGGAQAATFPHARVAAETVEPVAR